MMEFRATCCAAPLRSFQLTVTDALFAPGALAASIWRATV